jgi:chromate reductase, NAD(P)H dehydrogenase (quinone)
MSKPKIGVFIGSLRKESYSRKIARELESFAADKMDFQEIDLSRLELYNQDLDDENRPTSSWIQLREHVKALDGVLFVTPEYNRSVPAVLKNALDVASRPYGKSAWNGKPGAVVSVSPGGLSGFGANHHLRQSLVFLNVPTMQQPEVYIGNVGALLDENGKIKDEKTRAFLSEAMNAYYNWVRLNTSAR